MFQIETAGLVIRIENRYEDIRKLCGDYLTGDERKADLRIAVSEEELRTEMEKAPELFYGDGYGEEVVAYEKISNALPAFDAFVMHSSVVEVNGEAYAFAAESGTGKTTHTRYWKEVLGDKVTVINGDKPIYRFVSNSTIAVTQIKDLDSCSMAVVAQIPMKGTGQDLDNCSTIHNSEFINNTSKCYSESGKQNQEKEVLLAYGTPWCGKEGWQKNTCAPLKALCLLERGEENEIYPVNAFEHLSELMHHFHLPGNGQVDMPKLMELIDRMTTMVPVYRLRCRNDVSAAENAIHYFEL